MGLRRRVRIRPRITGSEPGASATGTSDPSLTLRALTVEGSIPLHSLERLVDLVHCRAEGLQFLLEVIQALFHVLLDDCLRQSPREHVLGLDVPRLYQGSPRPVAEGVLSTGGFDLAYGRGDRNPNELAGTLNRHG